MILPFDEAGQGRPIVLLHARPVDRTMWRAHLRLLAEAGVRAIALDLPGHGDAATAHRDEVTPWADVLDTLDHLGVDRFTLAGNSLGALVALQIAVTRSPGVCRVWCPSATDRTTCRPPSACRPRGTGSVPRWKPTTSKPPRGPVSKAWTSPKASDDVRAQAAVMMRNQLVARVTYGEPKVAADPLSEAQGALRALTVPTLVGVGELDMPDFFEGGAVLSDELGAGEVVVLSDAGHLAPLEQPEAFCALLLDFVGRLSA
ncbi:AB hydrolase-1 domain-containing protein OS=Streptomyces antimycoticus OX=68175 GN=SANT12839_075300 PE=4 SV=1 [Streptomyces antimycoticus]